MAATVAGVAGCSNQVLAGAGLGDRGAAEVRAQRGHVDAGRAREADLVSAAPHQLGGGALGHEPAVVDDHNMVGQALGFIEVVGRQQDGRSLGAELADHLPDGDAALRVDPGCGLVEEGDLRPADESQGQCEPALLTTRELAPGATLAAGQADPLEQRNSVRRCVVERRRMPQRFQGADARVHATRLEHHAHATGERGVVGQGVESGNADRACIRSAVALESLDRGRLAGAVGTEDGGDLARLGVERETVDRGDRAEADHQLVHLNRGHDRRR